LSFKSIFNSTFFSVNNGPILNTVSPPISLYFYTQVQQYGDPLGIVWPSFRLYLDGPTLRYDTGGL